MNSFRLGHGLRPVLLIGVGCLGLQPPSSAASFSTQVFATGSGINGTQPDSVSVGAGSVWVAYGNGAPCTDYTGSSTIAQYSTSGTVQNTYSLPGSVDGMRYNPNTGHIWALQNQDANSQLSIINPATMAISNFSYGAPYTASSSTRL